MRPDYSFEPIMPSKIEKERESSPIFYDLGKKFVDEVVATTPELLGDVARASGVDPNILLGRDPSKTGPALDLLGRYIGGLVGMTGQLGSDIGRTLGAITGPGDMSENILGEIRGNREEGDYGISPLNTVMAGLAGYGALKRMGASEEIAPRIALEPSLLEKVSKLAEKRGMTLAQFVEELRAKTLKPLQN